MGTTVFDTVIVQNISGQAVSIHIEKGSNSRVFEKFGLINLLSGTSIEVEDLRLNLGQLIQLQRRGLIKIIRNCPKLSPRSISSCLSLIVHQPTL